MVHSRSTRMGLGLLAALSTLDMLMPLLTDGEHPPISVAVAASVLGLASLTLIVSAWRGATGALPPLLVVRGLSALSAVPALFLSGVPAAAKAGAVAAIALNAIGGALVLRDRQGAVAVSSR